MKGYNPRYNRRTFLKAAAVGAAGLTAQGCNSISRNDAVGFSAWGAVRTNLVGDGLVILGDIASGLGDAFKKEEEPAKTKSYDNVDGHSSIDVEVYDNVPNDEQVN